MRMEAVRSVLQKVGLRWFYAIFAVHIVLITVTFVLCSLQLSFAEGLAAIFVSINIIPFVLIAMPFYRNSSQLFSILAMVFYIFLGLCTLQSGLAAVALYAAQLPSLSSRRATLLGTCGVFISSALMSSIYLFNTGILLHAKAPESTKPQLFKQRMAKSASSINTTRKRRYPPGSMALEAVQLGQDMTETAATEMSSARAHPFAVFAAARPRDSPKLSS
ncbi:hypothetical protein J8273_5278 [Carpediemonas membranifera]|uniref:Uncharacterized protein n=1 Tax=Carpediemonas membranifera TaxID=201153 RepID=A0A8J6DYI3_9EUKA|nr:hypothetical protein J8273_5278 [Carpediemonas membranifera]|eukprot:KAG9392289.1 hypothetical protein J8273_5278 [Carpediemonas membranifera]